MKSVRAAITALITGGVVIAGLTLTASPALAHNEDQSVRRGCDLPSGYTHEVVKTAPIKTAAGATYGEVVLAKAGPEKFCVVARVLDSHPLHDDSEPNWMKAYLKAENHWVGKDDEGSFFHFANVIDGNSEGCITFSGTVFQGASAGSGSKAYSGEQHYRC